MEKLSEIYKLIIGLSVTGVLLVPINILYNRYTRKRRNNMIEKLAVIMCNYYQNLRTTDFDLIPVNYTNYNTLDLLFYDDSKTYLDKDNFSWVGDFEESNFKNKFPDIHNFSRIMISKDTSIKATICHLKLGKNSLKSLDFTTEFTNGNFVITSNNYLAAQFQYPKEIEFSFYKTDSIQELLRNHIHSIQQILESEKLTTQCVKGISEIVEQNMRENAKMNSFRDSFKREEIINDIKMICPKTVDNESILRIADRTIELRALEKSHSNISSSSQKP
jgi:hypothetical protein